MSALFKIILIAMLAFGARAEDNTTYDRVSLDATASAAVPNDTLGAVLFIERQGRNTARLAEQVNQAMNQVLGIARGVAGVSSQTQSYNTSPVYDKGKIRAWRVRQTIKLESRDFDALGKLVGRLQQLVNVQSMSFSVSDGARRQAQDRLIQRAIEAFEQRARLVAKGFGRSGYRLVDANIDTGGPRYQPVMMRAEMAADMAAAPPALAAGTQQLTVTLRGRIEMNPAR